MKTKELIEMSLIKDCMSDRKDDVSNDFKEQT